EREFPQEPFPRTGGQRRIKNLAILAIGAVKTYVHARTPIPLVLAIVIEGKLIRPAIVSLPGCVRTLEDEVGWAFIAHDKNEIALQALALRGEFAEIDAADPIAWNFKGGAWLPLAFAQPVRANQRIGLHFSRKRPETEHVASACAAVITHAIEI